MDIDMDRVNSKVVKGRFTMGVGCRGRSKDSGGLDCQRSNTIKGC